ncbi:MAG: hypothetical protein KBA28_13155 [Syntrophaceae bacterium]|jgi:hypothetical protein|nr:hypothetical protein [Syntrophaceae bacterium]HOC60079.1 hypothetical protein [Smithellaceae bacterium]HQM46299.1 hypothetical protein [Smithellaceae bacterium]
MVESIKLLDVLEANIDEIAANWTADVKKNKRTEHYSDIADEKLALQAIKFYSQLRNMLTAQNRYDKAQEFFMHYARTSYESGIPLHESIYALNMMRRHMWLYADFQAIFINALEHNQAIDSVMRIMLLIDYAVYEITQYYQDRIRLEEKQRC